MNDSSSVKDPIGTLAILKTKDDDNYCLLCFY